MILILMGKAAVGKDTVFKHIVSKYNFTPIISNTTRPMRDGEVNGREYNFMTLDEYRTHTHIEERVYKSAEDTWYYGCPANDDYTNPDKDFIIIVDTDGAGELIEKLGRENFVVALLTASDETRRLRAAARGSFDEVEWNNRLADDDKRFPIAEITEKLADIVIVADAPIDTEASEIIECYKRCREERF